ncbi:MAG: hypothetical protein QOC82_104 [Frankiaceae bacterium]|nr:hypothetical protein [Frankiaceae bacterium]
MVTTETPAPPGDDPFVAGLARYAGGLRGRYARTGSSRWWTPLRVVLILTVLTSFAGYLQKAPCRTHGWTNDYQYTRVCYTDVFALYYAEQLGGAGPGSRLGVPYRDHPVEYPVVIGGFMWAAAELTNVVHPDQPKVVDGQVVVDDRGRTFFDITVLLLALCALLVTWSVARLAGGQRMWDAAMVALAPVLILDGFINWDLAAVALTCLALLAWARRRPLLAGVLIGLGTATKLYPLLVLVALLPLCARAGRLKEFGLSVAGAAGAIVAVYVPVALWVSRTFPFPNATCDHAHPLPAWRFFYSLSQTRGEDWGSPWLALRYLSGDALDRNVACGTAPVVLNIVSAVCFLGVVALVYALVVFARTRPRLPQIVFLLVAGFILVNKVDSPQYCLWLLPLAVLSRPRWGPLLVWQGTELLLTVANFYALVHLDHGSTGIPDGVYEGAFLIRDIALLWIVGLVVRDVLRPEHDVVRASGYDDPAGGPLDAAEDRWSLAPDYPTAYATT